MRKKFLITSALVVILGAGSAATIFHNENAYAKNKQPAAIDAKKAMTKYSPPKSKKGSTEPVRTSRLKEMNIVGEAANVLNVLPIDIINEMNKGKTLVQVAKDKGLTEAEFNKKLTDFDAK